jgi:transcription elongation factor Elf1
LQGKEKTKKGGDDMKIFECNVCNIHLNLEYLEVENGFVICPFCEEDIEVEINGEVTK